MAADLADPAAADAAVRGADVVYQCVSPTYHRWPIEFPPIHANVIAAVEAAGAKLVMADNLYMYGPSDGPLTESTPLRAADAKGVLRARMAEELLAAHAAGRIRVAIGRSSDYYGPGRVNSAVSELLFGAVAAGKQPRWLASLDEPHSLSYLPDTAAGLVTLGERHEADGRVWHLPVQPPMTGRQWADRIAAAVDRPVKLGRISRPMLRDGRRVLAAHPRAARHAVPVGAPVGDGRLAVPIGVLRRPDAARRRDRGDTRRLMGRLPLHFRTISHCP